MFESNTDLEFDEIFGESFEPDKTETPKRTFENKNSCSDSNKKPRFYKELHSMPVQSMLFANKVEESSNNNTVKSATNQPVASSPPQLKTFVVCNPTRRNVHSLSKKKVVLRKFPGPAGLLPERTDFNIEALQDVNNKDTKQTDVDICSQLCVRAFREGPWEQMCKDFSSPGNQWEFLPDKYNIAWIKAQMKSSKLINQKGPFLAAIIHKIECSAPKTPVIILKDATGQIHATIINNLYEEYVNVLKVGSVVVLKQFGVLKTDHVSNHYLTITANSLVSIYSEETRNQSDSVGQEGRNFNQVVVTVIQKLSVKDFLKNISEVKARHKAAVLEQKLNFGSVHLNLRPLSEGSLSSCRSDFAKIQTSEPRSVERHQLATSNCDASNAKCTNYNNSNAKANSILDGNFRKALFSSSSSLVNYTQENHGLLDTSVSEQRFKKHTNNLYKPNDASHSLTTGPKTQIASNLNINKSGHLPVHSDNRMVSQLQLNNNSGIIKCSQISVSTDNLEHSAILEKVFEGVDADLLFEDF